MGDLLLAVVTTFSHIKQINLKQLVIEKLRREAEDVKRDQVKFHSLWRHKEAVHVFGIK